jgi:hypothetical protein
MAFPKMIQKAREQAPQLKFVWVICGEREVCMADGMRGLIERDFIAIKVQRPT